MKELYITHSINQFGELEYVIDAYGAGGYGFYWHLLEKMAKSDGALPVERIGRVASELGYDPKLAEECTSMLLSLGLIRKETHTVLEKETECYVCDSVIADLGRAKALSDVKRQAANKRWNKNSSTAPVDARAYAPVDANGMHVHMPNTNTNTDTNSNSYSEAKANKNADIPRENSSSLEKKKKNSEKKEKLTFSDECVSEMDGKYGKFLVLKVKMEIMQAEEKGQLRMRNGDALLRSWLKHKHERDGLRECLCCGATLTEDQTCHECGIRYEWDEKQYRWVQKPVFTIEEGAR